MSTSSFPTSSNAAPGQQRLALESVIAAIDKHFGKNTIMRLSEEGKAIENVPSISTGSLSLDVNLGIGGLPKGRVVEIYGTEASGKTTLTLHCVAECQKAGGTAAFIDAEHALDVSYASRIGVDTQRLLVSQPDCGEQALEIVDMLVRSGGIDMVVVDSVAALVPKAEIEGEMGDSHMGLQARLMSQALRKLTSSISRSNCIVIFINQVRMKIGVMFGNPETTTGGQALKFYSSVRLEVRRSTPIKNATDTLGHRTKIKVVKNKVSAPFKECEVDIMFGLGISRESDVLDLASELNVIQKSGTWFTYGEERMGQGRENAKDYLKEHPETMRKVEQEVRRIKNVPSPAEARIAAKATGATVASPAGKAGAVAGEPVAAKSAAKAAT